MFCGTDTYVRYVNYEESGYGLDMDLLTILY